MKVHIDIDTKTIQIHYSSSTLEEMYEILKNLGSKYNDYKSEVFYSPEVEYDINLVYITQTADNTQY